MPLDGLRALVLDAYGTLFDLHSAEPACEALFPGKGAVLNRLWRAKQLRRTRRCVLTGRYVNLWEIMDRELESACRELGLHCSATERASLREQYLTLQPYPEVPHALGALGERYRLLLLSHGTQSMLEAVAEHSGLAGRFEAIRSADLAGAYKPNPRAYALAEHTLRLPPREIGFVSTNPFDIAGAKAFGLRPIWLHRGSGDSQLMKLLADGSIENLDELVSVLGG